MALRLMAEAATLQAHAARAGGIRQVLDRLRPLKPDGAHAPLLVGLRGEDPYLMAILADGLLTDGHRLALLPTTGGGFGRSRVGLALDALVDVDQDHVAWTGRATAATLPPCDVAYYTSGSTGQPKGVGVSLASLRLTTDWYRLIYRLDRESVILTSMPFTYNFPFVAAFCQSRFLGTPLAFAPPDRLPGLTRDQARAGRRAVLLANPVILEHFLEQEGGPCPGLLIDSGGAPLSRHAVAAIREQVGELRERYGLTETCSLTHFDLAGDASSLGTVGQPMPGVETEVRLDGDGKPRLWVQAPNACQWIDAVGLETIPAGAMLPTGDLGAVDAHGNLRLLARADDHSINGCWPRDTLHAIGPALGTRCALVQHKAEYPRVRIRLRTPLGDAVRAKVVNRAARFLDLPDDEIGLSVHGQPLLHSIKLPRA